MANKPNSSKKRVIKKPETMRQKSERTSALKPKTRRLRTATSAASRPLISAAHAGSKHYFVPKSKTKFGKFLNKPRRFTPKYFRESWAEVRLVTWPSRRETIKLTIAVVIFALIFGGFISGIDYIFEKLFREVIL